MTLASNPGGKRFKPSQVNPENLMFELYCEVLLKVPIPAHGLVAGDRGVVVHVHGKGEAYEVEFMTSAGETIAVVTALADQLTHPHGQADGASDVQA